MVKKIAVLGGGNGAHMMAADMKLSGHEVRMFELPQFAERLSTLFETRTITVTSVVEAEVVLDVVTSDIEEAVTGADYILVVTPAFAHGTYAELLTNHVSSEQVIVTFPGAFAALRFRKAFAHLETPPVVADANNLPYDVRLVGPATLALHGYNNVNIAFLPAERGPQLIEQLRKDLVPFRRVYEDVLECGLSLANPALHTGPALLNVSHIESPTREFFLYEHGVTPSSMKVNIVLDAERKEVGAALGYDLRPIEDFAGIDKGALTWQELYKALHGEIALTPISGPNSVHNRYMTEDAPYGLVPWANIGAALGVSMPLTNAVIDIYNVIHETDWRANGLGLAELGLEGMSPDEIRAYVTAGEASR